MKLSVLGSLDVDSCPRFVWRKTSALVTSTRGPTPAQLDVKRRHRVAGQSTRSPHWLYVLLLIERSYYTKHPLLNMHAPANRDALAHTDSLFTASAHIPSLFYILQCNSGHAIEFQMCCYVIRTSSASEEIRCRSLRLRADTCIQLKDRSSAFIGARVESIGHSQL